MQPSALWHRTGSPALRRSTPPSHWLVIRENRKQQVLEEKLRKNFLTPTWRARYRNRQAQSEKIFCFFADGRTFSEKEALAFLA
jgi:hypothetical protein